jgi:dihydrofolate reductase
MEHDLVDEYRLMIFPVVLGSGRRLFPETREKTVLTLADTPPTGIARTLAGGRRPPARARDRRRRRGDAHCRRRGGAIVVRKPSRE